MSSAFPVHAQTATSRIWQEVHDQDLTKFRKKMGALYVRGDTYSLCYILPMLEPILVMEAEK